MTVALRRPVDKQAERLANHRGARLVGLDVAD